MHCELRGFRPFCFLIHVWYLQNVINFASSKCLTDLISMGLKGKPCVNKVEKPECRCMTQLSSNILPYSVLWMNSFWTGVLDGALHHHQYTSWRNIFGRIVPPHQYTDFWSCSAGSWWSSSLLCWYFLLSHVCFNTWSHLYITVPSALLFLSWEACI